MCRCIHCILIILQAGIVLSFKTTVDDTKWSDSKRVNCVDTFTTWYHIVGWRSLSILQNQWMTLNGQTVGGMTDTCVDTFTTWYHIASWHSLSFRTTVDDIEWSDSGRVNYLYKILVVGSVPTWFYYDIKPSSLIIFKQTWILDFDWSIHSNKSVMLCE